MRKAQNKDSTGTDDERDFGFSELQLGKDIVRTLKAIDPSIVDKEAFVGTLTAVDKFLKNAQSSLK